ncbi:MFS transporter [Paenibacillus turpanensis]|uniref:MFS transporter n=1 Tax=Paenibacillus turpanensis TaxID=2689078 RepID=UPI0014097CB1|nr:MFS transporter [Paenibacillus turpanensis]
MSEKPDIRSFFANRFVQAILISNLFLQVGIWVRNFAILLYVTDQTNNDPIAVSLISVAEFAPIFIFSFIGGTFADRWKPKRTMVWSDLLSAASIFFVLLALVYGSWKAVFFATLVSSILSQFSQPSGMKLFKQHVPESQMQMGMSLFQTTIALFMILGPMLGTYVYFQFGIQTAIGIMGVCFLLSAAVLMFLPADRTTEAPRETKLLQEMGAGFRYVLSNRLLITLGGVFLTAGFALGLINPLGIFFVTETLGLEKDFLQWFTAVNGVAMIIGGVLAMGLSKGMAPQMMLAIGMTVSFLTIGVFGLTETTWIALTAQFFSGLLLPAIQISINTMILKNTEEAFVGRVNGIMTPLFMGAMVVTMSAAGVLKQLLSLPMLYLTASALFLLGVLILLPVLRLPAAAAPVAPVQQGEI